MKNGQGLGRILIMDDERIVRESVTRLLQILGYTVVATRNGEEALAQFRQADEAGTPFAAAILDLIIDRGLGGRDTVVEMRKQNPTMPILVVSGYSNDPVMAAPKDFQFTDCIRKPFRSALLIGKLEYHLQQAGQMVCAS